MKRLFASLGMLAIAAPALAQDFEIVQCQTEDGHHVIFEERTCPVDGTTYTGVTFLSYSSYGRFMDWEPISYMSFPYPVDICRNGFVVDRAEEDFTAELISTRMQAVQSPEYQALSSGHTSFWLFYSLMKQTGESPDDLWWLALQSSWEADMCQTGHYETYVRAAITEMDAAVAEMSAEHDLFTVLNFLRANMRRRVGDFEQASEVMTAFRSEHGALIDEDWQMFFQRLEAAVADGATAQLPLAEPDND